MSNLAKKVNDVLCGNTREVNTILSAAISKINDNVFCNTEYYLLSSCCGAGPNNDYYVIWDSLNYTPSALTIGNIFTTDDGDCFRVTGYTTSNDVTLLPNPYEIFKPENVTPTIYTGCTDCINDSNPCKYDVEFCCTGLGGTVSGSFSGSGETITSLTLSFKGNNRQTCATIKNPTLGEAFPATGGTIYDTCEQCTSGGTNCFYAVSYCCDESITGINQGWLTGNTTFVDPNGDCYTVTGAFANGPATLTGTTSYTDCVDCITNENPCLYNVSRCCDGTTGITSYNGALNIGSAFVDPFADCWVVDSKTNSGTVDVTYSTEFGSCCDCMNSYPEGAGCFPWEVSCCFDSGSKFCVPKYLGTNIGDFIQINGICYEITGPCGYVIYDELSDCNGIFVSCDDCASGGGHVDTC